jgi:hypothetical protein
MHNQTINDINAKLLELFIKVIKYELSKFMAFAI